MSEKPHSRRHFLRLALASALAPLLSRAVFAGGGPPLEESDPAASALGYRADASAVDDPLYKAGSTCGNCMHYQGGEDSGHCALFPGKTVQAGGWCKAWVKKP